MTLLDGKKLSLQLQEELHKDISKLTHRRPGLAFILVGDNAASQTYVKMKKKACAAVEIESFNSYLPADASEEKLIHEIQKYNHDPKVDGILVQLPLPSHMDTSKITLTIDPRKDVDGFHPVNVGKMLLGEDDGFLPCTPNGIKVLLEKNKIPVESRHVVIVGRSNIVGKPLAAILMQKKKGCNATVTVAHTQTHNLPDITKSADILVAALGKPKFITKDMVKKGAVVIDVGINKIYGTITGDVDFEHVAPLTSYITPVPGGIGPMTIAMLLKNTYLSFLKHENRIL